ncbi:MAG: ABC transporter permease [Planctomycetaceae bacterium]|nr:ABC transporter permease [Planctomycetaceae bacterium]
MNRQHLKTILWLRWRLNMNQWSRAGKLNQILSVGFVIAALATSVLGFFATLIAGCFLLPQANPDHLMLLCDGVAVGFLICWLFGLMAQLQRTDSLSLDKLLHLPISPTGAFLLNYVSSLFSLALIIFLPLITGLAIAMVIVKGPAMLMLFPLLLGFLFMVTAVTYQFRGWLALLMLDKRRRRTITVVITVGFILLVQIPNLLNMTVWQRSRENDRAEHQAEIQKLQLTLAEGKITPEQHTQQLADLNSQRAEERTQGRERFYQQVVEGFEWGNMLCPLGWLPYGVRAAALGNLLPGLWGTLGGLMIGAVSLRRSYRTTLRIFTGDFQTGVARTQTVVLEAPAAPADASSSATFLEKRLRWVTEHAAVVALANFRSLTRAPEAKMMLLTPVIMLGIFGSMLFMGNLHEMPLLARPIIALGAIVMTMVGLLQVLQNLFGFDRDGFRVFVLTPTPRRDVLIGKNLSIAPLALAMCGLILLAIQIMLPLRFTHFLATLVQSVMIYFIFCMVGNLVSILSRVAMKPGTFAPAKPTLKMVLIQLVGMMLFPLALLPTVVPLGLDLLLDHFGWRGGVPVYLILTVMEFVIGLWIYKQVVSAQGRLLLRREKRILDAITVDIT